MTIWEMDARWIFQFGTARYFKIKQHIEEIATGDDELTELLLSPAVNFSLKACYDDVLRVHQTVAAAPSTS